MSIKINNVVIFFDKKNSEFYITKSVLDNLNLSTNNTIFKDGVVYCRIDPNIIIFMRENENTNKFPYRLGYKRIDVEKSVRINNNQSSSNTSNRGQGQVDSQRRGKKELVFFYNQYEDYYFTTLDVLDAAKILPVSKFEYKGVEYYKVIKSYVDMLERFSNDSNNQFKIVIKTVSPKINISGNSNNRNQNSSNGNNNQGSDIVRQIRIDIHNDNVTTKYNYGQYQGRVERYLSRIYKNSMDYFSNPINNTSLSNLQIYIGFLDLYLHYYFQNYNENFDYIFDALENSSIVRIDDGLDPSLYGDTRFEFGYISMNKTKNWDFIFKYFAHELGHVVNHKSLCGLKGFMSDLVDTIPHETTTFSGQYNPKKGLKSFNIYLSEFDGYTEGINLLDEAITQDRCEDIYNYYSGRIRPSVREKNSPNFYNGESYKSNFSLYGEFEEIAVLFGSLLDEVKNIGNFEDAMRKISTMALSSSFSDSVIKKITNSEHKKEICKMLCNMGWVKQKMYRDFGLNGSLFGTRSVSGLDCIYPAEARKNIRELVSKINGYGNSSGFRF